MKLHWHASIEDILLYGFSAILVINVTKIVAGHMADSTNNTVASIGSGIGALVH